MNEPTTTWDAVAESLTDVLGRLSEGTVLQWAETAMPEGGRYAQLWQDPEKVHAEVSGDDSLPRDRWLPTAAADRMAALGWDRPIPGRLPNWSITLDWPAPPAEYRRLAAGLVGAFRDVFGLTGPAEVCYTAWSADTGERVPLPELGLDPLEVTYYARLAEGDTVNSPTGLVRRVRIGHRIRDEALHRDGHWGDTETIDRYELGELPERLVRIDHAQASRVIIGWRRLAERLDEAGSVGGTPLRLAASPSLADGTTGADRPRLDGFERGAVSGYLRGAPIAVAAMGFARDPLAAGQPEVVPLNVRTDGTWVWPEALGYFAERYGIAPEPEFLNHIRGREYRWPEVDDATLRRAAELR